MTAAGGTHVDVAWRDAEKWAGVSFRIGMTLRSLFAILLALEWLG